MRYRIEPDPTSVYFRCVEDSNDAVMITDIRGRILYVNPAWRNVYGYASEEALGKTARLLHSGRHDRRFYEEMWRRISDRSVGHWKGEIFNRSKSGAIVHALLLITPFRSPDGAIVGYMGIAADISEQKRLESKLRAQESLAAVRHFAERLAHEIGTTLGVVRGRTELIVKAAGNPAKVAAEGAKVLSQVDRIAHLVGYLLEFCRGSAGGERHKIHLRSMLEKIERPFRERMTELDVEFRITVEEDLRFLADRRRLRVILNTLLENALDAIERAVKDGRSGDHAITACTDAAKARIRISVHDTGCGIHPDHLDRIFHPFFTTKDVGEGTGIGLTLASRLAEDMGGSISVQSTQGKGSEFCLELPL